MKKFISVITLSLVCFSAFSQILVTEIMYNPPESGTDSLEYMELYNSSDQSIDLTGYNFSLGIEHTFDQTNMEAGEYLVICVNSAAMKNVFGIDVMQWTDGALQNGGETIELMDGDGNIVFSVDYDDSGDWPGTADGTDGEGASIELCDVDLDSSDPFNWAASESNTGISLNGREISGSPGTANNVMCRKDVEIIYTKEEILNVKEVDSEGTLTKIGEFFELNGIVYGININANGLSFTIIDDGNNGISVYNPDNDLGYSVTEGDHVSVFGQIVQFSGLARIEADSIALQNSNNNLLDPDIVTSLAEDTESSLVKIENLSLVDANQWEADGGSFNVMVTNGSDEFLVRIWGATDMSELPAPEGLMSITGIGGQFDNDSPFTEGYQLSPRYASDIEADNFASGPTYTQVNITDINGEEADGIASNLGDFIELTAVAHGINFRPEGLQFTIIDPNNNGIGVYSETETWGYEFTEGDEVTVWGEIDQFFGLIQIELDSIALNSQGNSLVDAKSVSDLDESTESSFVVFQGLDWEDASQWLGDGTSFNVELSNGTNTIQLRIDSDSEFASMPIQDAASFVYGIGGQFDPSTPLDEGYQLFPLRFEPYLSTVDILPDNSLNVFPNPSNDFINVRSEYTFDKFQVIDISGKEIIRTVNSKIDIGGLKAGSYILVAQGSDYIARTLFQKM